MKMRHRRRDTASSYVRHIRARWQSTLQRVKYKPPGPPPIRFSVLFGLRVTRPDSAVAFAYAIDA